jgi:hypothetical protein
MSIRMNIHTCICVGGLIVLTSWQFKMLDMYAFVNIETCICMNIHTCMCFKIYAGLYLIYSHDYLNDKMISDHYRIMEGRNYSTYTP